MAWIEPSGFHHLNLIVRTYLEGLEEILSKNGLNAVLNLSVCTYPAATIRRPI